MFSTNSTLLARSAGSVECRTGRTYLQYKLCSFRIYESQSVEENIDEFERLVEDESDTFADFFTKLI